MCESGSTGVSLVIVNIYLHLIVFPLVKYTIGYILGLQKKRARPLLLPKLAWWLMSMKHVNYTAALMQNT